MTRHEEAPSFTDTVGASIRCAAEEFASRDFLVMPHERLTFGEAERESALLARRLLERGVGKGTRVGLYFTYGRNWIVAWLAASRIGALVMPLSTLYTPSELRIVLRRGDVAVLISARELFGSDAADTWEQVIPSLSTHNTPNLVVDDLPFLRHILMTDATDRPWATPLHLGEAPVDERFSTALLEATEREVVPGDVALVVYTSGSTAEPKGVVHTPQFDGAKRAGISGEICD